MTDRAVHGVRVVRQEHIALLHGAVVALQEAMDERAELANDHLAVEVRDQRKLVVLLANAGDIAVRNSTVSISKRALRRRFR
jgi:histidinol dehydrogenase